jgi:hypothetical protein
MLLMTFMYYCTTNLYAFLLLFKSLFIYRILNGSRYTKKDLIEVLS